MPAKAGTQCTCGDVVASLAAGSMLPARLAPEAWHLQAWPLTCNNAVSVCATSDIFHLQVSLQPLLLVLLVGCASSVLNSVRQVLLVTLHVHIDAECGRSRYTRWCLHRFPPPCRRQQCGEVDLATPYVVQYDVTYMYYSCMYNAYNVCRV